MDNLKIILSLIDLTSLEGTDNRESIFRLCSKAKSFAENGLKGPAAVCVYPPFIRQVKKELIGTGIHVASVAGAFPAGQSPLHIRISEVQYAIDEGADEIDMVISRGRFLEGDTSFVFDEISAIREVSKNVHLKVILETGELKTVELIKKASEIAISAGADFIKTSTGKITPAATTEAVETMLEVISSHYKKTGKKIGIKPAGGISEPEVVMKYMYLVKKIAGDDWINPAYFRIGASRLADNIMNKIANENKF